LEEKYVWQLSARKKRYVINLTTTIMTNHMPLTKVLAKVGQREVKSAFFLVLLQVGLDVVTWAVCIAVL
jgi:hypothetical protein